MNPGISEDVSKTAQSTIEALKSTPVVLALVIFNVLYMAGSFWSQVKITETYDHAAERWKGLTEAAMKQCTPFKLQSDESTPVELPPK